MPLPDKSQNDLPIPYPSAHNGSHFPPLASNAPLATTIERFEATVTEAPIEKEVQPCPPPQDTATPATASDTNSQPLASDDRHTASPTNASSADAGLRNLTNDEIKILKAEQAEHNLAPPEKPKEPPLCAEQQHAMDLAMQGHNVFITGSGGCGKSVLVKALYRAFSALLQGSGKTVDLIAPTGQAALNIEGRTTYNYAGWTPDDLKKPLYSHDPNTYSLIRKAQGKKIFKRRVMSATRKDTRPFGGVQMIVVGDFCQLPPVDPFQWCMACGRGMRKIGASSVCPDGHGIEFEAEDKWAFKSPEWTRCNFKTVHLTKIHRQQDEAFIGVLQKCRLGRFLETDDVNLLLNHESETENATELKSTKEEVAKRNKQKFDQIPGKIREYQAIDAVECVQGETSQPPRNLDDHRYAQTLQLKANTPVVLLANIDLDRGLCNGRQGTVIGFVPGSEVRRPEPPNRGNFEHDDDAYRAAETRHSKIVSFLDRASASGEKFPLVQFSHGVRCVIGPDCSVIGFGDASPYSHLSRCQIPLAQGWAMTIHKSQSLSLDRVTVDLAKIFEHGQAYVALSRARSLRGLKIEGATAAQLRSTFRVDYAVEQFMETFEAADIEDNPAGAQEEDESSEEEEEVSEISQEEYVSSYREEGPLGQVPFLFDVEGSAR
ncbi:ATP-dependent DNA helicase PIF1 [Colletotrichum gloeosporioides Cg-14]|uniref:ATP-dependent DNA helicase n=1 Tax=Colletotrichum gloeosporioides (strain Cg-14) TaxID=1237896 RepID=T0LSR0_COLGC|nr:ATP-dependent DNA helicase PIF1 [Colletotrichum gloeosporioides Cg-14]